VHGSITNALLQAVDAQSAYPDREVISMWGDGGFSMMMGDFFSLTQLGLSVKVTVPNNGLLGFVELEMKARSFLDPGCDLKNPNFALMARAMGDRAFPVAKPAQKLKSVTEAAFAQKVPAPLDVMSARQELAMPPKMALDQAYHFGIFTMKAVLVGRVAELIDLAGVNFTR
jgi:pyruvate dehydrogenase (quinone)